VTILTAIIGSQGTNTQDNITTAGMKGNVKSPEQKGVWVQRLQPGIALPF